MKRIYTTAAMSLIVALVAAVLTSGHAQASFTSSAAESRSISIADTTVVWNTFLGGNASTLARGIAVDRDGNIYVAGYSTCTWGSPLKAHTGGYNAFVAKLDDSGNLVWNTFFGSSRNVWGSAIAVDGNDNIYVAGYSDAVWGAPVRAYAGGIDAFAAKLDGSGNLTWNTFLGSSRDDWGNAIAVDAKGNVYVAGDSNGIWGSPLRIRTAGNNGFVAGLDSTGNLVWNTFLGGSGDVWNSSIAVDGSDVYVAGYSDTTWGSPLRPHSGGFDAFAARLDNSGNLAWNTFLGGSQMDFGYGIAADSGNVYITGYSASTWGSSVQDCAGGYDAFVARLDSSGGLTWNTFMGGTGFDLGRGIAADTSGNVYVAGFSFATWGVPGRAHTGSVDAFAAKVDGAGRLLWNTFLGSTSDDSGSAIAVDDGGNVYAAGLSASTWGFPLRGHAGDVDAFAARMSQASPSE